MTEESLQPQSLGGSPPQKPPSDPGSSKGLWILAVVVLLSGLVIIGWLSSRSEPLSPPVQPTATPQPPPSPTPDPALRAAAEQALENLIAVMGPLRTTAPDLWAGERWTNVLEANGRGDQALADQAWTEAEAAYIEALETARGLQGELPRVPARLMPKAVEAYAAGKRDEAVRLLEAVLRIEAERADALDLLPRAGLADQSFALLQNAAGRLEEGDLEVAYADITRLMSMDDRFPGARELLAQIESRIADAELKTIVGRGVAALDAGDLVTAQAAVGEAEALAPNHPAVQDLSAQVAAKVLERQILDLKAEAESLKEDEKWKEAHAAWLKMASLDPDAPWVAEGLSASLRWAVIDEKLSKGLANPFSPQTADWVKEFADRKGWPSGLARKAERLESEWKAWNTPVEVTLISDGETEVTVSRTGRWKSLVRKELKLLPGSYVAKGGRLGYRDVRVEFEVSPGQDDLEITVICTEGI